MVTICAVDGVELRRARMTGNWIHVGELDEKTREHDPDPINADVLGEVSDSVTQLRNAAGEMLRHHSQIHPVSECEWYKALLKAWQNT